MGKFPRWNIRFHLNSLEFPEKIYMIVNYYWIDSVLALQMTEQSNRTFFCGWISFSSIILKAIDGWHRKRPKRELLPVWYTHMLVSSFENATNSLLTMKKFHVASLWYKDVLHLQSAIVEIAMTSLYFKR